MARAVELVRERLLRVATALDAAKIPYAIIGGNAVAVWVARVDPGAVRNTPDVDVLLRRSELELAKAVLAESGFVHREEAGTHLFLDGPQGSLRSAVHLVFANEKVHPDDSAASPDVTDSEIAADYRVISLEALVRLKLTSFRLKDRVHLRDLLDVGLIDASWLSRVPPGLASRLQELIDDPNG
jgi:hypothetical protein